MNKEEIRTEFADVSIRGRLAFGVCCLIKVIENRNQFKDEWTLVIERLWSFTESYMFNEWLDIAVDITPYALMDDEMLDPKEFVTLSKSQFDSLRSLYAYQNQSVLKIVDDIYDVGSTEVYGGVELDSPTTLNLLLEIFREMDELKVTYPDTSFFKKFRFKDGFGDRFTKEDRSEFQKRYGSW